MARWSNFLQKKKEEGPSEKSFILNLWRRYRIVIGLSYPTINCIQSVIEYSVCYRICFRSLHAQSNIWLNFEGLWALTCDFLLPSCVSYHQTKKTCWNVIKIQIILVHWPRVKFSFILLFRPKRGKGLRGHASKPNPW